MMDDSLRRLKWIGGAIIAIVLGALGSGIWETVLGPLVHAFGALVLDAVSWVFRTFEDALYQEVARGLHEAASEWVLGLLTSLVAGFAVGLIVMREVLRRRRPVQGLSLTSKKWIYPLYLYLIFASVSLFIFTQYRYQVNRALTHYRQSLTICAPFLSREQVLTFEARFARIRTRQDYVNIISELNAIAKAKNQELPEFEAW